MSGKANGRESFEDRAKCGDAFWACILDDYLEDDHTLLQGERQLQREHRRRRSTSSKRKKEKGTKKTKKKKKKKPKEDGATERSQRTLPRRPSEEESLAERSNMIVPNTRLNRHGLIVSESATDCEPSEFALPESSTHGDGSTVGDGSTLADRSQFADRSIFADGSTVGGSTVGGSTVGGSTVGVSTVADESTVSGRSTRADRSISPEKDPKRRLPTIVDEIEEGFEKTFESAVREFGNVRQGERDPSSLPKSNQLSILQESRQEVPSSEEISLNQDSSQRLQPSESQVEAIGNQPRHHKQPMKSDHDKQEVVSPLTRKEPLGNRLGQRSMVNSVPAERPESREADPEMEDEPRTSEIAPREKTSHRKSSKRSTSKRRQKSEKKEEVNLDSLTTSALQRSKVSDEADLGKTEIKFDPIQESAAKSSESIPGTGIPFNRQSIQNFQKKETKTPSLRHNQMSSRNIFDEVQTRSERSGMRTLPVSREQSSLDAPAIKLSNKKLVQKKTTSKGSNGIPGSMNVVGITTLRMHRSDPPATTREPQSMTLHQLQPHLSPYKISQIKHSSLDVKTQTRPENDLWSIGSGSRVVHPSTSDNQDDLSGAAKTEAQVQSAVQEFKQPRLPAKPQMQVAPSSWMSAHSNHRRSRSRSRHNRTAVRATDDAGNRNDHTEAPSIRMKKSIDSDNATTVSTKSRDPPKPEMPRTDKSVEGTYNRPIELLSHEEASVRTNASKEQRNLPHPPSAEDDLTASALRTRSVPSRPPRSRD